MKREIKIILSALAGVLLITLVVLAFLASTGKIHIGGKGAPETENRYVTVLNKNYPTDILILGENFEILEGLRYRQSDVINDEVLKTAEGCNRQAIILSCYNGTFDPTIEQLKMIAKKLNELKCDVYFVGNKLDDKLVEAGIIPSPQKENYWMGYVNCAYGEINLGNGLDCSGLDFNDEEDRATCIQCLLEVFLHNINESLR